MSSIMSKTVDKIKSFASFEKGWCYGTGDAVSCEVVDYAIGWLNYFSQLGFSDSNAFPGNEGEVLLSFYIGEANLDLMVYADCEASLIAELEDTEVFALSKSPVDVVREKIQVALAAIWNMSVSSIPGTSIIAKDVLKAPLLKIRQTTEAPRYSNSSAAYKSLAPSALTFNGSTQTWGAIRQSIGFLKPKTYHQRAA